MNSGVYKITNVVNNNVYIGSTVNIGNRWREHRRKLNSRIHNNKYLQRAWNKYGWEKFRFEILESVLKKSNLLDREQYYLDLFNPEYNIRKIAESNFGIRHSEEKKIMFSKQRSGEKNPMYGRHHTKKTKKMIGLKSVGRKGGGRTKGCIPWNKGLTQENDERVKTNIERMAKTRYGVR